MVTLTGLCAPFERFYPVNHRVIVMSQRQLVIMKYKFLDQPLLH